MVGASDEATVLDDVSQSASSPEKAPSAEAAPVESQRERPDNVPEKFWNAETGEVNTEALLQSYQHLESKQGQQSSEADADTTEDQFDAPVGTVIGDAQRDFAENGQLSEDNYAALEAAGIPRTVVDSYVNMHAPHSDSVYQAAYNLAGGSAESYAEMQQWATEILTEQELASFNVQVMNDATWESAISNMYARYQAESPNETPLLSGTGGGGGGIAPFSSAAEMQKAMSSKQYATDADYRQIVAERIQASERAGVRLFS